MKCSGNRDLLVVDNDADSLKLCQDIFSARRCAVQAFSSPEEALTAFHHTEINVALLEYELGRMNGVELARQLLDVNPYTQIFIFTAFGTPRKVEEAAQAGLRDFISKPIDPHELAIKVEKAFDHHEEIMEKRRLESEHERLKDNLIGKNSRFVATLEEIFALAPLNDMILLHGETGTGKELVARAIHRRSPRRSHPLAIVNCPALTDTVLESELFGHVKGSFTGAYDNHKGFFETADKGTIFLDEIGDLSEKAQSSLLRVLENGEITRLGSTDVINTHARVIAATNRDLQQMVNEEDFREDLLIRINTFSFVLTPLRERADDIPLLADYFIHNLSERPLSFTPAAIDKLSAYRYPGNVRELRAIIRRAIQNARGSFILPEQIRFDPARTADDGEEREILEKPWHQAKAEHEKRYFTYWYHKTGGDVAEMSRQCRLHRTVIYDKLKSYAIGGEIP